MQIARRSFLFGAGASLIAAPAIVRAASLMPVKSLRPFNLTATEIINRALTLTGADGLTVEQMIQFKRSFRHFGLEPGAVSAVYLPPGTLLALHF